MALGDPQRALIHVAFIDEPAIVAAIDARGAAAPP